MRTISKVTERCVLTHSFRVLMQHYNYQVSHHTNVEVFHGRGPNLTYMLVCECCIANLCFPSFTPTSWHRTPQQIKQALHPLLTKDRLRVLRELVKELQ